MKILSLNIWGGTLFDPLITFIKEHSVDIDIFCFQEVFETPTDRVSARKGARANVYQELVVALPDHLGHFTSTQDRYEFGHLVHGDSDWDISYGSACFIRKNVRVLHYGERFVFKQKNELTNNEARNNPRVVQCVQWDHRGTPYTMFNFHGLWHKTINKEDYPDRITQSQKVRALMEEFRGEKILLGDFNLNPDTQSFSLLANGMRNLIQEYGITSTRSSHYTKDNKLADYTLVTPGINVAQFTVPTLEVSDHLPMILEIV